MSMPDEEDSRSFIRSWVITGKSAKLSTKASASNLSCDLQCKHCEKILGDEEKRTRYDSGEDIEDMGGSGGGFNPIGGGGQQFTFHFEGGFPGGGFPGGDSFFDFTEWWGL